MKKAVSGYRLIFGYLGLFIAFVGIATLLPLFALFAYPDEAADWYCFFIPGISAIVLGSFMFGLLIAGRTKAQLGKHQDSILLLFVWVSAILISATPFMIAGIFNFTDAIFETTSAYATVGLSVLNPKYMSGETYRHLFVLYRTILCFVGGVGLVLIVTSAISDRYGLKLYLAEGHNDKLMPNLARSARLILSIYFGITMLGVILYVIAGMPVFDAIVHSISAVATGGFSSRPEGIMYFAGHPNFWAMQIISVLIMVLGSTNFLLTFFIITGRFKKAFKDAELRLFGCLMLIFIPTFILAVYFSGATNNFGEAAAQGAFTFFSASTTTGFSNVADISKLGHGVLMLVVFMNIMGGCMGSTAGGIKLYRMALAIKSFYWSTKESTASPNVIYPHYIYRFGEQKEVDQRETANALGYIFLYGTLLFVGAVLISIVDGGNTSFGNALFEFSNAISSTGLSVNVCRTGNNAVRWVLTFGMLAGRLEILPIYFAVFRGTRDIFRKETY